MRYFRVFGFMLKLPAPKARLRFYGSLEVGHQGMAKADILVIGD
jgi:hypothetical protein